MINAEIEARELQNKLSHICPDAKIDFKIPTANEAVITIHNPNGGLPINIFSNDSSPHSNCAPMRSASSSRVRMLLKVIFTGT